MFDIFFLFFCLDVMVVPSPGHGSRALEPRGVLVKSVVTSDDIVVREGGMMDVGLSLRRRSAIEHGNLCSVITDCLQDVCFAVFMMPYFSSLRWILFTFAFMIGDEADQNC
jgi:hypothetical protein